MMHPIHTITPIDPRPEFISLIRAKEHLKIDFDDENDLINIIIEAAIEACENYMGICIFPKTVVLKMKEFAPSVAVNYSPIKKDTVAVSYKNTLGNSRPFDDYVFTESFGQKPKFFHIGDSFPDLENKYDAVQITYEAGIAPGELPKAIEQAILLTISDFYEYRTDRAEIHNTRAMSLMRPYKIWI